MIRRLEYRVGAWLAALLVVIGLAVVMPQTPAHAEVPCYTGQFCTYKNINFQGDSYYYTFPGTGRLCINMGGTWINSMSSAKNYTNYEIRAYTGRDCGSILRYVFAPGEVAADWSYTVWNDNIESFLWTLH